MLELRESRRGALRGRGGFTLAEVMVAVGVVAVGLLPTVALFSLIMDSYAEIKGQRAASRSLNALSNYLNEEVAFETVYQWAAAGGPKELAFLTYRTNGQPGASHPKGEPVRDGRTARSVWLDVEGVDFEAKREGYESAREGPWIKAVLELAGEDGEAPVPLPALEEYKKAYVMFTVRLYSAVGRGLTYREDKPLLTTVAVALR